MISEVRLMKIRCNKKLQSYRKINVKIKRFLNTSLNLRNFGYYNQPAKRKAIYNASLMIPGSKQRITNT